MKRSGTTAALMKAPLVQVGLDRNKFSDDIRLGVAHYRDEATNWILVNTGPAKRPFPEHAAHGAVVAVQNGELIEAWRSNGASVVNVAASLEKVPFPSVLMDNARIGEMAAEHFLERQFGHFAYVGFLRARHAREREQSYRNRVAKEGKTYHPYPGCHQEMSKFYRGLNGTAFRRWLEKLPKPCALFCNEDGIGMTAVSRLLEAEIDVPAQVAVLGVNNEEIACSFSLRPLSSIDVNGQEVGYRAARLLHRLMEDPKADLADERVQPLRVATRVSSDITAHEDVVVAKALQFIRNSISQPIGVPDVARNIGVSKRVLERQFSRHLKRGPYEEIVRQRMRRAQQLLATTDWPIHRIASACGYPEYSLFSTTFRRREGISPRQWRDETAKPSPTTG